MSIKDLKAKIAETDDLDLIIGLALTHKCCEFTNEYGHYPEIQDGYLGVWLAEMRIAKSEHDK